MLLATVLIPLGCIVRPAPEPDPEPVPVIHVATRQDVAVDIWLPVGAEITILPEHGILEVNGKVLTDADLPYVLRVED
jgi:hypothetical protein